MAGAAEKQTQATSSPRICPRDIRPRSAWRTSRAGGDARQRLVLPVAGAGREVGQHLTEVIDVVVKAGHSKTERQPGDSGRGRRGQPFPVASPGEVGEQGGGKELEDGGGAQQDAA